MSDLPNWLDLTGEEKDAIIRPLWDDGKTASEIMAYFVGASRNAIIGRVTRGKMGKRAATKPRAQAQKAIKAMRAVIAPKKTERLPMASPAFVSTFPEPEPIRPGAFNPITDLRPPLPGLVPLSILELPRRDGGRCRFPVIGGYCGAETETTYCASHSRLAFNPTPRNTNGSLARQR